MSSDIGERRFAPIYLALSAAAIIGLAVTEDYTDKAVIPVPGDKPTLGFGATTRDDGSPVKMSDRTTPPKALGKLLKDVEHYEGALRQCVTVPLAQNEYDVYVSLAYNIGESAFCSSSLVRKANAMDYAGACAEILRWRFFQGRDCSLPGSGCSGLWSRRQGEYKRCMGGRP